MTASIHVLIRLTNSFCDFSATTHSTRVHPDLLAKQQEHLLLQRLLEATTTLLARAEQLADSGDVMAEGGAGTCLIRWVDELVSREGWASLDRSHPPARWDS